MFYVLYAFKAFSIDQGISTSGHSLLFRTASFGVLFFMIIAIFEFVLTKKISIKTIKHKLIWYLSQWLVGLLLIFLLFNYFWNFTELYFDSLRLMGFELALVMVVPIGIRELWVYFSSKLEKPSIEIKSVPTNISFTSENGKDEIILAERDFLYISAAANYVEVHYLKNEMPGKRLLRTTLKRLEDDESLNKYLLRVQRSYIVNPLKINRVDVKKGRMFIYMGQVEIKVSPSFEENVKKVI
ncbi:MAG: LytTR family transcriptional regulator [Bacteroidia bacterium]